MGKGKKASKAADSADKSTTKGKKADDDSSCPESELKASDRKVIKRGSKEWNDAVKDMKSPSRTGKNYRVETEQDARDLLKEARGDIPEKPTYTPDKYQRGFEVHPEESGSAHAPHQDLPHIKWKDWSGGKSAGADGHIFFGE